MEKALSLLDLRGRALTETERDALERLFGIAASFDRDCIEADAVVYQKLGFAEPATPERERDDGDLNAYVAALRDFWATIALAALARLEFIAPFAEARTDTFGGLYGAAGEPLIRPIFEESGIGDRFVTAAEARTLRHPPSDQRAVRAA